jgi:hypothetical protein
MADWSTAASLATAVGTLVLALTTFVAVQAANRVVRHWNLDRPDARPPQQ